MKKCFLQTISPVLWVRVCFPSQPLQGLLSEKMAVAERRLSVHELHILNFYLWRLMGLFTLLHDQTVKTNDHNEHLSPTISENHSSRNKLTSWNILVYFRQVHVFLRDENFLGTLAYYHGVFILLELNSFSILLPQRSNCIDTTYLQSWLGRRYNIRVLSWELKCIC